MSLSLRLPLTAISGLEIVSIIVSGGRDTAREPQQLAPDVTVAPAAPPASAGQSRQWRDPGQGPGRRSGVCMDVGKNVERLVR